MARIRKLQKILPITFICILIFILLVIFPRLVTIGTLLPQSEKDIQLTDWQFYWSETLLQESQESADSIQWKHANQSTGISRPSGGRYIHLQTQLPKIQGTYILHLDTEYNPIKIKIDGQTLLQNGYGSQDLWTGNNSISLTLDSKYSGSTLDIYMQAPISFYFSASLLDGGTQQSTGILLQQWKVLTGYFLCIFGLLIVILSVILSIKNKNMGKLALSGLILLLAGALYLLPFMDSFLLDAANPLFFKLQLAAQMLLAAAFLTMTIQILNRMTRGLRLCTLALFLFPAAFSLIQNNTVLYYMLQIYPLFLLLFLIIYVSVTAGAVTQGVNGSGWVYAGVLLFGMTFLYDLSNFTYTLQASQISYKLAGMIFYFIILLTISLKQLVYVNIRLDERDNQIKRDAMWIERVIKACASIFGQQTMDAFCIQTAKSMKELIINDAADQENGSKAQSAEAGITIQVGLKTETGYLNIYTEGTGPQCDYALIESKHTRTSEHVSFGNSFLDILLFEKGNPVAVLHFEGIAHGLSENLKNIILIAYSNISVALDNLSLKCDMDKTQETVFLNLADISESKSEETGAHAKRVTEYVRVICEELHMDPHETDIVAKASMMHDIGKLAVPEEIITKKGSLSDREFEIVKQHVLFGYHIMSKSPGEFMQAAAVIAQQHHEQWNGGGYLGLRGEEIHPYARIVALVDVFDALLSERSYKAAWSFEQTCGYINEQSGLRFDPAVVQAFNRGLYRLYKILEMYPD